MRSWRASAVAVLCLCAVHLAKAQPNPTERTFPQKKAAVEAAIQPLQATAAGHLPVLDGFVVPGDRPLDRFQKGYYQCSIQVTSTTAGETLVHVSAKITAWYNAADKSGYQVLPSNGRLETDFLDRLSDALNSKLSSSTATAVSPPSKKSKTADAASSASSADLPPAPSYRNQFPSADRGVAPAPRSGTADQHSAELDRETQSLQEILRNQSHPNNLAAVRKSGTPVFSEPNEGAKLLFLAEAEDEFEILESNVSWVHVRISGLSRAWIRRSSLEMPDSPEADDKPVQPPAPAPPASATPASGAPFQIESEQTASFPGDWTPLRGKVVRIVSVQKSASAADTGPQAKMTFVKGLLDKEYADLTQTSSTAAGIVLIFDSADGGMVAATLPVLREWKSGSLSEEALWRRCYLDPPEIFHVAGAQP